MRRHWKQFFINHHLFWIIPISILLGIIIAFQYRIVSTKYLVGEDTISSSGLLNRQHNDLLKEKQLLEAQLVDLQNQLDSYKKVEGEDQQLGTLRSEIDYYKKIGGFTDVTGSGITIQFSVSNMDNPVNMDDFYRQMVILVNELNAAGAEAISIKDERIISTSEIRVAGNALMINGNQVYPPFVIRAIGDKDTLEGALILRFGFVEQARKNGYFIEVKKGDDIAIGKYPLKPKFKYAETVQ